MKDALVAYFGVESNPATWATIAGQITSTQANKTRRSWAAMANAAKRLSINSLAKNERTAAMEEFSNQLKAAAEKESARIQAEEDQKEVHDESPTEVPTPVQIDGVVSDATSQFTDTLVH
jgi:hypothetical protein